MNAQSFVSVLCVILGGLTLAGCAAAQSGEKARAVPRIAPPKPPEQITAPGSETFNKLGCADRLTLCLDKDGYLFSGAEAMPSVMPGEKLVIQVIAKWEGAYYEIALAEDLIQDTFAKPPTRGFYSAKINTTLKNDQIFASRSVLITERMRTVRVEVRRLDDGEPLWKPVRTHTITVNHGRYFADVGLMIPLVVQGQHDIGSTRPPGSADRVVTQVEGAQVNAAIALNLYPGGHPNSVIMPDWRRPADYLGLQLGVDINLASPRQLYVGGLFEPVSGVSLGLGLALLRVNLLNEGYEPGLLLRPGEEPPVHEGIIPRFYVAATLSTEAIDMIRSGARRFTGGSP